MTIDAQVSARAATIEFSSFARATTQSRAPYRHGPSERDTVACVITRAHLGFRGRTESRAGAQAILVDATGASPVSMDLQPSGEFRGSIAPLDGIGLPTLTVSLVNLAGDTVAAHRRFRFGYSPPGLTCYGSMASSERGRVGMPNVGETCPVWHDAAACMKPPRESVT